MGKDAFYFSHDTNARRDPKILALRSDYGTEGYGWYWIIIEMLSEQEGYKLQHKKWVTSAVALEMQTDPGKAEKFIQSCITEFELFQSDGAFFWSESLQRRMNIKEDKRQKKVEAGKKGAEMRWKSNDIAATKQPHSNAIAKDSKVKESKVNEIKENEKLLQEESAAEVFTHYQNNIGLINSFIAESIGHYIDDGMEPALINRAIDIASAENKPKWSYIDGILKNKANEGIKTLAALENQEAAKKSEAGKGTAAKGSKFANL